MRKIASQLRVIGASSDMGGFDVQVWTTSLDMSSIGVSSIVYITKGINLNSIDRYLQSVLPF